MQRNHFLSRPVFLYKLVSPCLLLIGLAVIFTIIRNSEASSLNNNLLIEPVLKNHILTVEGEKSYFLPRLNLLDHITPDPTEDSKIANYQRDEDSPTEPLGADLSKLLSHTFILTNQTEEPIQVDEIVADCSCISAHLDAPNPQQLPYLVSPNSKIKIVVQIDPLRINSGRVKHVVRIKTAGQDEPLATLQIGSIIDSGVSFGSSKHREDILTMPTTLQGFEVSRLFSLTLDARLPGYLPLGTKMRLISVGSNLKVTLVSTKPTSKSGNSGPPVDKGGNLVNIEDDVISFATSNSLKENCVLNYRVSLDRNALSGPFDACLVLATNKTPKLGILRQIVVPVQGFVRAKTPHVGS